jgi:rare lipoprotein A
VTTRARAPFAIAALSLLSALAVPALARTGSGGAALSGGPEATGSAQPAAGQVSSSRHGITVTTERSAFLNGRLVFTGHVPASDAGETIAIERYGHQTHWTWAPTAQGTAAADGSFRITWQVNHIGRFAFRAVLPGPGHAAAGAALGPTVIVTVYRPALATLYGPGFYGQRTACGEVLRRNTLGVANRTLPCGMRVAIYYRGTMIVVAVIDRGPYANGADWDLTMATARVLRIPGTVRIGAVSLPRPG